MFDLFWVPNFIKIKHTAILRPNLPKFLISGHDMQFQISYLWLMNLSCSDCQISFFMITKFSWNERIDTCFNVECVLLGCNFDFLGGYCLLPSGYCSLLGVTGSYFLLLVVTTSYRLLLLIPPFSMNELNLFPRSCKIAKVKLLFKKGSKTAPQNYRSISLLPNPSKIVERIIYDQRQEFLSKNKILYRFHSIWFLKKLFH